MREEKVQSREKQRLDIQNLWREHQRDEVGKRKEEHQRGDTH